MPRKIRDTEFNDACRRSGKAKLEPMQIPKKKIFVKEGNRLRVLQVGCSEVLRAVLPLCVDSHATCGGNFVRMGNTAKTEGLTSGCTIHVLKRLKGGATMGGMGIGYIPGHWQCLVCGADECWPARPRCNRCAQPCGTPPQVHGGGPPAHVLVLVPCRVLFPK